MQAGGREYGGEGRGGGGGGGGGGWRGTVFKRGERLVERQMEGRAFF